MASEKNKTTKESSNNDGNKSLQDVNLLHEYEECKSTLSETYERHTMADEKLNFFFVPLAGCLLGTPTVIKNIVDANISNGICCVVSVIIAFYCASLITAFVLFLKAVSYKSSLGRDPNCFLNEKVYLDKDFVFHSIAKLNECINSLAKQVEEKHRLSKWVFIFTFVGCILFLVLAIFPWIMR